MRNVQITFDYEDFNTSTRRDTDVRRHGIAKVCKDSEGKMYIFGDLGCGKSRDDVGAALIAYLGGRQLLAYRVYD